MDNVDDGELEEDRVEEEQDEEDGGEETGDEEDRDEVNGDGENENNEDDVAWQRDDIMDEAEGPKCMKEETDLKDIGKERNVICSRSKSERLKLSGDVSEVQEVRG